MSSVVVTRETTNIKFAWTAPSDGSSTITDYTLQLYQPDTNSYGENTSLCSASTGSLFCTVSIADLMSNYDYEIGDLVKAKVFATNARGSGTPSSPNTSGAEIALVP